MAKQPDSRETTEILERTRALAPLVRESIAAMDEDRRLPPPLVDALRKLGAFRMGVPRVYGGLELDPMTQVRVVEELSRLDGSVGWCSMVSSAGSFAAAFLAPAVAQRLCGFDGFSLAGQVVPMGRADLIDGGYRVNGRYRFGSGCRHASMIIGGSIVYEDGKPLILNGRPEIRVMVLPTAACKILDTWYTTGLAGTGSDDFVVEDVFVPFEESWSFPLERPHCAGILYRFSPFFLVTHAGVPLGIARAAIDALIELASRKEQMPDPHKLWKSPLLRDDSRVHEAVATAEVELEAARSLTYSLLEEIWQALERGEKPSSRQRALYRSMLVYVHRVGKQVVETMYDLAATSSIYRGNPLDRLMRDILTACQHGIVQPKVYQPAGRMLLGLDAGDPMF